ncbi:hypothetical protein [Micromonospora sp. NPDC049203]|uniref:hypothetical protein n=1 Tax=Micromonospora sp. NPDC049203 TaxID=3364267 RepID=UPI0037170E17
MVPVCSNEAEPGTSGRSPGSTPQRRHDTAAFDVDAVAAATATPPRGARPQPAARG